MQLLLQQLFCVSQILLLTMAEPVFHVPLDQRDLVNLCGNYNSVVVR